MSDDDAYERDDRKSETNLERLLDEADARRDSHE